MQHQQGIDPPIVLSFKEVFEDPETNQFSLLEEDTSSSSAAYSEEYPKDLKVPKFMMRCERREVARATRGNSQGSPMYDV